MYPPLLDFLETLALGLLMWAALIVGGIVFGALLFLLGEVL